MIQTAVFAEKYLLLYSTNAECSSGRVLFNGMCFSSCPEKYYVNTDERIEEISGGVCLPCHYTCKSCNSGADYQCAECYDDAILFVASNFESYCYPKSVLGQIQVTKWYYRIYVILVLIAVSAALGALSYLMYSFCGRRKDSYILPETVHIRQMEKDIKTKYYSDSE